jgi:hypothetical protein
MGGMHITKRGGKKTQKNSKIGGRGKGAWGQHEGRRMEDELAMLANSPKDAK